MPPQRPKNFSRKALPPASPAESPSGPPAPGLAARKLAYKTIEEVLRTGRTLDDVYDPLARDAGLEPRDAALARAICIVAFRRLGTIRAALEARLKEVREGRLFALFAASAAQVLFLDVPDHAAVATAVDIANGERGMERYAGLVNAVLRRFVRERDEILAGADPLADVPKWLAQRWIATYGRETAIAIAAEHRQEASLDITVVSDSEIWAERLDARLLPTGSLRLASRAAVTELPGFEEGKWWVQDAAAAIPARLLGVKPGERVADLCAAPGGKTAQLAAAGAQVVAVDRSAKRLERVRENLGRLGLEADIRAIDALNMADEERFDAILLDAPCSSTGTLRRHPDVAWTKTQGDIVKLADLQLRLLDKAASMLAPGGRLVFCTCSLEPEEGELQAQAFLARHPDFARVPIRAEEIGGLDGFVTQDGDFRSLPHLGRASAMEGGLDGFFAARFSHRGK
jgi:16S rRNA (cytosine967-C5)-methyltransferase